MPMNLSKYEQETIVTYNAKEPVASIYTCYHPDIRKLDKLVTAYPDIYKCVDRTDLSCTYEAPKSYIAYRKPRNLSKEYLDKLKKNIDKINAYKRM